MRYVCACMVAVILAGLQTAECPAAPAFSKDPVAETKDQAIRIAFTAAEATDCAVWILDGEGAVVRHLAAGVLGANAPAPFAAGMLDQSLVWDGADDAGKPSPAGTYTAKVALGTKAVFERVIGFDSRRLGAVYALAVGPKGELYAYCSRGICVLDRNGNYVRQIAPAPEGMPVEKLAGLEPVTCADGSVCFRRGYALPGTQTGSMAIAGDTILLPGPPRYARSLTRIGLDGSVAAGAFDTRLTTHADNGYLYLAASPDGNTVYMSGAEAGYKGDDARKVDYRHSVYRLRLDSPGPAETFTGDDENRGGPGFAVNYPKGLAVDPRGNLYVCNYGGDNIAVYAPDGGVVKSFKVHAPQLAAVHPATGQVYVLAGEEEGYFLYDYDFPPTMKEARLVRLSADGEVELETKLADPYERKTKTRPGPSYRLCMAADFGGERPAVWIGTASPAADTQWSLIRIEDEGGRFGEPAVVIGKQDNEAIGTRVHLCLDRQRDIVYVNLDRHKVVANVGTSGSRLLRFAGDGTPMPFIVPRDAEGKKLKICEPAIGPDGSIYALVWQGWGYRNTRIVRFDREGTWLPFPKAPDGVPISKVLKGGSARTTRGLGVGPDGRAYALYYDRNHPAPEKLPAWDRGFPLHTAVARVSLEGEIEEPRLIAHLRSGANGVRVDRRGNVYVADHMMPLGVSYPRDLTAVLPDPLERPYPARLPGGVFDPLLRNIGSVLKFSPKGGRIAGLAGADARAPLQRRDGGDLWKPAPAVQWILHNNNRIRVEGAEWQYHGMSPIPAQYQGVTHVERCVCVGGRFDLDEFDRVFVPDELRRRVTVLDGAGNVVLHFGTPGNQDSAGPGIGLASPRYVAAASDRVYVHDTTGSRIVKVRLEPAAVATCRVDR